MGGRAGATGRQGLPARCDAWSLQGRSAVSSQPTHLSILALPASPCVPAPAPAAPQICMSTNNLYQRCLAKSTVAHAAEERNPAVQLEAVGHFVSDLREAIRRHAAQAGQHAESPPAAQQQGAAA